MRRWLRSMGSWANRGARARCCGNCTQSCRTSARLRERNTASGMTLNSLSICLRGCAKRGWRFRSEKLSRSNEGSQKENMNSRNLFIELKRRNVYKVAVAYVVAGWALSQGIAQVFPVFDVPNWAIRMIVLLIIVGFPVAVVLAWFFEITPEGIKRTEVADAANKHSRGKTWIYIVVIGAALSVALFLLGR